MQPDMQDRMFALLHAKFVVTQFATLSWYPTTTSGFLKLRATRRYDEDGFVSIFPQWHGVVAEMCCSVTVVSQEGLHLVDADVQFLGHEALQRAIRANLENGPTMPGFCCKRTSVGGKVASGDLQFDAGLFWSFAIYYTFAGFSGNRTLDAELVKMLVIVPGESLNVN